MEISWPGEKLAIRLWETVERLGIGICSPAQIRREGAARADVRRREKLLDAQTLHDIEGIRSGASTAELLLANPKNDAHRQPATALTTSSGPIEPRLGRAEEPRDLVRIAETGFRVREVDRLIHLRATHRIAEDLAEELGDEPPPDKRPTNLWINQWEQGAAEVDEEQLRQLWARLLIGEVSKPGSVSQKTIFTLRQMSADDARLFEKHGPLVIDNKYIIRLVEYFNTTRAVEHRAALKLEDLGLLSSADNELSAAQWLIGNSTRGRAALLISHNGRMLLIGVKSEEKYLKLPVIRLTEAGSQLMRLGKFPQTMII